MTNLSTLHIRQISAKLASTALIILAALLAITALVAQSTTPAKPSFKCTWHPDAVTKAKVKAAFETALQRSSSQESWRRRLVASPESGKTAIREILQKEMNEQIVIPDDVAMVFYEYETGVVPLTRTPSNPKSQCAHIFFLPDFAGKETTAQGDLYGTHLQCCYDPW
jgi:hypothetical protein